MIDFITELRELSDGKPIGFKLCVGQPAEFLTLVEAMVAAGTAPDFITIDGGEGGTGAAPPELSDSVGMPMREGLRFAHNTLIAQGIRDDVRLIAAGKIATGFDIIRCLALGADLCYSARAMMLAMGCIQARRCHTNECPVGIATQDPKRAKSLTVPDKSRRVAAFHRTTVENALELIGVAGCEHPSEIDLGHINRRVDQTRVVSYLELYPPVSDVIVTVRQATG